MQKMIQVQIRDGVFETASSSVHSIVVHTKHANDKPLEPIDGNDTIIIPLQEFGWGFDKFNDLYSKLSYLLTFTKDTEYRLKIDAMEEDGRLAPDEARLTRDRMNFSLFKETKGFKMLDDIMFQYCGYHIQATDNGEYPGYIDHQSCEDFEDIEDYLNCNKIQLRQFLFDTGVEIWISNDNESDLRYNAASAPDVESIDGKDSYYDYVNHEYIPFSKASVKDKDAEFEPDPFDDDEGTDISESGSAFRDEGTVGPDDYDKEADKYYDPTKGYASWNDLDEDVDFGDDDEEDEDE